MKVAVLNYTGTVGKTTIAAHLLSPRMNNAQIFAIESINETAQGLGLEVEMIKGKKFKDLFKKLIDLDDAIIDVGASNVEGFLNGMAGFEDSHFEIDFFIVPVTNGTKEQKETMSIITTLAEFGITPEKIKVIFNRVESDAEEEFNLLINFAKKSKNCTISTDAVIYENEIFDMISIKKLTITEILSDETDYKAKAREIGADGNAKTKSHYLDMHIIKSGAKNVNRNLNTVFNALFA